MLYYKYESEYIDSSNFDKSISNGLQM